MGEDIGAEAATAPMIQATEAEANAVVAEDGAESAAPDEDSASIDVADKTTPAEEPAHPAEESITDAAVPTAEVSEIPPTPEVVDPPVETAEGETGAAADDGNGEGAEAAASGDTPAEETVTPVPDEEAAAPVPGEQEAAPAPVEETAAPAPVEETAAPAPVEETSAPAPVAETAPPPPAEKEALQAPREEAPASAPVEEAAGPTELQPPEPSPMEAPQPSPEPQFNPDPDQENDLLAVTTDTVGTVDHSYLLEGDEDSISPLPSPYMHEEDNARQLEGGYASDNSLDEEVSQIIGAAAHSGEEHMGETVYYTRNGQAVVPANVDQTPQLLNSPRFREACQIEGILVDELFRRDISSFKEKGVLSEQIQMRADFFEKKRVEIATIALDMREKVISRKQTGNAPPPDNSTMIEKEKRKNELKRNQMEKRNVMMAEYDAKIKRLRGDRQERIDHQAALAIKAQEDQEKRALEKEIVRYQRAARKKRETQERFEAQEQSIMERAAEMEAKADANLRAVSERQAHEAKIRAEKREIMDKRIANCLEADTKILEGKRNKFFHKQAHLAVRKKEQDKRHNELADLNEIKQQQAAERRKEVKARDIFLQEERLRKAAERDVLMEQRNKEMDNRRELEKERSKLLEDKKQVKRDSIKARDKEIQEKKRNDFFEANAKAKQRRDLFFEEQDHEITLRKEVAKLQLDEKQKFLERHKRIKAHERELKLDKLRQDKDRIQIMVNTKNELLENRKVEQRKLWDSRVRVVETTPGPGEYNPQRLHTLPAYKFGLKYEPPRPKPEPGPGAYAPVLSTSGQVIGWPGAARIGKGISKSALDWEIHRASKIPGPQDYMPTRPSSCPTVKFSAGEPQSEFEIALKNAAKIPGPQDYSLPELDRGMEVGISKANPKGYLDWAIHRAKQCPGPQDYDAQADKVKQRCPTMKLSRAKTKNDVDWAMIRAAAVPGPGEYEIDITYSSGPHGTKNSSKTRPAEARASGQVATGGKGPTVTRPHSSGARAANVKLM